MPTPTNHPIICGTDFSESAKRAANVAAAVAQRLGARLLLVHGVDERGDIPRQYWPVFMAQDRPHLSTEAARLRELGAEVREELAGGVPDEGVVKCAEKAHARLIVLGSGSKGTLDRWVLGSAAERIAESAPVPTLIVRNSAPIEAWARGERVLKIFVGADFTSASDSALQWVAELEQLSPSEITLGFVDRRPEERADLAVFDASKLAAETAEAQARTEQDLRAKAERWFGQQPVILRVTPAATRIDVHLLDQARDARADLIVIGTHQWRGLSRLRHASVSRRILRDAHTNVACVPSPGTAARASAHLPQVRRVLVATDLSEHGGRAIPHAYSMLGAKGAVCLLHVLQPGDTREPVLAQLRDMVPAEATNREIETEVQAIENRDTAAGICEAADRFDADLICIGTHGRSGLSAAVLGSVAHEVIARSHRPVLVVRPPCS